MTIRMNGVLATIAVCFVAGVVACNAEQAATVDSGEDAPANDTSGSGEDGNAVLEDADPAPDSLDRDGSTPAPADAAPIRDVQADPSESPDLSVDTTESSEDTVGPSDGSVDSDLTDEPDTETTLDAAEDADVSAALPASFQLLFVGNSYIYTNDLPSVVRTLLLEAGIPASGLVVDSVTYGGYRLEQHAADAAGTGPQPRLRNTLVGGGVVAPDWDVVVLQEQSQIPGFGGGPEYAASQAAALELHGLVDAIGGETALFMTWGYRTGDARNSAIFPDYLTMQTRLVSGYMAMADGISRAGGEATVVAVGEAWRRVWQADIDAGRNPLEAGSLFLSLHSADLSHPAPAGTYLTACVFVHTLLGVDVRTLDATTPGVTDAALADRLQELAMAR